jgi:hypothetical protein
MRFTIIGFDTEANDHVVEWENGHRGLKGDGPEKKMQEKPENKMQEPIENKAQRAQAKKSK